MAKQTFTAGQVLTAAEMNSLQENDYNWTVTTKTASYTLAAGDEGTRIVMNNAGATTITVDDAIFSAGDVVWIHNIGAGTCTITAGTATVNTAASLDLAQWEGGSLYFTSASSAIFFRGAGGVGNANFTDTETGTYSSGGKNYKYLTFTASGTLTVDVAGLADILVIAGGAGGGVSAPGGGGAGGYVAETVYLQATTHNVTVGAGGATSTDGSDSNVGPFAAAGGGRGGGGAGAANPGGSAGGGAQGATVAVNPLYGGAQGNAGGVGNGGGGGAGGAGYDGFGASVGLPNGGLGGAGLASSITNTSVTRASGGSAYYDAPGATRSAPVAGGGGGSGKLDGDANSGGGGAADGGLGGSGVVIVRVEV